MRSKRVLLVEDNYDNRAIYLEVLRHAGYEVFEAANGAEGVVQARKHRPDLILMDLSMPVMSGWEALKELRRDAELSQIPALALSAHVLLGGAHEKAVEAGFRRYLTKPIEPHQVLEVVREVIGPARPDETAENGS